MPKLRAAGPAFAPCGDLAFICGERGHPLFARLKRRSGSRRIQD
jgi:hypothetical protein